MNGIHDMGGMDGFGAVEPEEHEPVFHARWEGAVLAATRVMGAIGGWNIDQGRYGIELLPPNLYLTPYYRRWLERLEWGLVTYGYAGADEIAAGRALCPGKAPPRGRFTVDKVDRVTRRGTFTRETNSTAKFAIGDRVRARNLHPKGHTRLPRYVRGHAGVIERLHGCQVFPDSAAMGQGENPQWLYTVRFDGRELWGADADPTLAVSVEAFEPYLEALT
ncbi:MAG: nitrile hydratase subunit beta [Proteobacteria bacterium]|nr:nitrile hydratase subunit beta [Pseudomonadota bacterium]